MDKETIKVTFDLRSLAERDTTLRKSGAYHIGPCPFCGGVDRFTMKETSKGWRWHCRKCGNGKYHDSINYIMRRDNLLFVEALRSMGGTATPLAIVSMPMRAKRKPVIELPMEDWQEEALHFVDKAGAALLSDKQGVSGREYLQTRGITLADWYRELLGFSLVKDPKVKVYRPAIVIPHFDNGWKLTAVKLRFVDNNLQGLRYIARKGSKPLFWGLHTAFAYHKTLVLVEGELNAISIRHCMPCGVSVLSFGSENITAEQAVLLPILAGRYKRVIVWRLFGISRGEATYGCSG